MKKLIVTALISLMTLSTLAGCNKPSGNTADQTSPYQNEISADPNTTSQVTKMRQPIQSFHELPHFLHFNSYTGYAPFS